MYPKFIELHWNTIPLSYNVENILWFGDKFIYIVGQDIPLDVDESYDDIKGLITDCGCLIHKADPRLNMDHPLTMDDLMTMVGEPVWNRNLNVWLLVKGCSDMYVDLMSTSGNINTWDEKDLESLPLYRMRK